MNNIERLMNVLQSRIVSEKTSRAFEHNQVVFKVLPDARKNEIKQAVEHLFKVDVVSVNTINMKAGLKTRGRVRKQGTGYKKAYVTLRGDKKIELFENEAP